MGRGGPRPQPALGGGQGPQGQEDAPRSDPKTAPLGLQACTALPSAHMGQRIALPSSLLLPQSTTPFPPGGNFSSERGAICAKSQRESVREHFASAPQTPCASSSGTLWCGDLASPRPHPTPPH